MIEAGVAAPVAGRGPDVARAEDRRRHARVHPRRSRPRGADPPGSARRRGRASARYGSRLDDGLRASVDDRWLAEAVRQGIENALKFSPADTPIDLRARGEDGASRDRDRGPRARASPPRCASRCSRSSAGGARTATRTGPAVGPRPVHRALDRARTRGRRRSPSTAPEGGTILQIRLPPEDRTDGDRPTVSLLICDDHKVLTDALSIVVGLDSSLTLVAPAGAHARGGRGARRPSSCPTWCLMDIVFKGAEMTGIEATRRIKERSPSTKVVDHDRARRRPADGGSGRGRRVGVPVEGPAGRRDPERRRRRRPTARC